MLWFAWFLKLYTLCVSYSSFGVRFAIVVWERETEPETESMRLMPDAGNTATKGKIKCPSYSLAFKHMKTSRVYIGTGCVRTFTLQMIRSGSLLTLAS